MYTIVVERRKFHGIFESAISAVVYGTFFIAPYYHEWDWKQLKTDCKDEER